MNTGKLSYKIRSNRKKKKEREERKANKKCVLCGINDPIPGMLGCDYCYSHNADYKNELQQGRRELGFCVQCGEPVKEINPRTHKKYARCAACLKYNSESQASIRTARLNHGLCIVCGDPVGSFNPDTGKRYVKCIHCGTYKLAQIVVYAEQPVFLRTWAISLNGASSF